MRQWIMLAGAAALAFAGQAAAKPGNGHGNGNGRGYAQGYAHDNGRGHGHRYAQRYGDRGRLGYGVGGCPPGLAKKGCMPPGQAKKFYRGERYPMGYGSAYAYRRIPYDLRRRYDLGPDYRYYYSNGYIYVVDPRTLLIEQVIRALLYR